MSAKNLIIDKELLDRFKKDCDTIWELATELTHCRDRVCNKDEPCEFYSASAGCMLYYLRASTRKAVELLREEAKKQEVKEMTVDEIEALLGYSIKVVKE